MGFFNSIKFVQNQKQEMAKPSFVSVQQRYEQAIANEQKERPDSVVPDFRNVQSTMKRINNKNNQTCTARIEN